MLDLALASGIVLLEAALSRSPEGPTMLWNLLAIGANVVVQILVSILFLTTRPSSTD